MVIGPLWRAESYDTNINMYWGSAVSQGLKRERVEVYRKENTKEGFTAYTKAQERVK